MIGALVARNAVAGAFRALNRHDLPGFMSAWAEDSVFTYPGDIHESGTFRGKKNVEGWFRHFLDQFQTIEFEVKDICMRNIFALSGNNVAAAHWSVRLVNSLGREGRNSGVTVITVKGGKVTAAKDFLFDLGDSFRRYWSSSERVMERRGADD